MKFLLAIYVFGFVTSFSFMWWAFLKDFPDLLLRLHTSLGVAVIWPVFIFTGGVKTLRDVKTMDSVKSYQRDVLFTVYEDISKQKLEKGNYKIHYTATISEHPTLNVEFEKKDD
jgi:hypothetical protein